MNGFNSGPRSIVFGAGEVNSQVTIFPGLLHLLLLSYSIGIGIVGHCLHIQSPVTILKVSFSSLRCGSVERRDQYYGVA